MFVWGILCAALWRSICSATWQRKWGSTAATRWLPPGQGPGTWEKRPTAGCGEWLPAMGSSIRGRRASLCEVISKPSTGSSPWIPITGPNCWPWPVPLGKRPRCSLMREFDPRGSQRGGSRPVLRWDRWFRRGLPDRGAVLPRAAGSPGGGRFGMIPPQVTRLVGAKPVWCDIHTAHRRGWLHP